MSTELVYEKVLAGLCAEAGLGIDEVGDGTGLFGVIARRVRGDMIGWSTAKGYASVVRWGLRRARRPTDAFDRSWARLRGSVPRRSHRRRSTRRCRITPELVATLRQFAALRDRRSRAAMAVNLFHASALFGLRPCEWSSASWDDAARHRLVVRNAKAAATIMEHGPFAGRLWVRGNGSERTLELTAEGVGAGVADLVDEVLRAEREVPWSQHRSAIWDAFKRLVRAAVERGLIEPKYRHLTIYSARHQFAADAKRSMSVTAGEVAAVMGHCTVRTAVSGYGRRVAGGSFRAMVRPVPESVALVRNLTLRRSRPAPRAAIPGLAPGGP